MRYLFRYIAIGNVLQYIGIWLLLDNLGFWASNDPLSGIDYLGVAFLFVDWLINALVISRILIIQRSYEVSLSAKLIATGFILSSVFSRMMFIDFTTSSNYSLPVTFGVVMFSPLLFGITLRNILRIDAKHLSMRSGIKNFMYFIAYLNITVGISSFLIIFTYQFTQSGAYSGPIFDIALIVEQISLIFQVVKIMVLPPLSAILFYIYSFGGDLVSSHDTHIK